MTVFRASLSMPYDTALPRDAITLNPHFSGDDAQLLANALKANCIANNHIADKPFTIKIYDAQKAPPSYPLATASQTGAVPSSAAPRDMALCVSYYTTYNRPRFRGRLYLPAGWFGAAPTPRPSTTVMQAALTAAKALFGTGLPSQTNWVVYSPTEGKSQGAVNNLWCDNEWDTVRKRGLAPDARELSTVP
jgi:hypothetical protein